MVVLVIKNLPANTGDEGLNSWVRKIPTPVFLPGESHGQRSLVGDRPWACRVGHDLVTEHTHTRVCACTHTHTHIHTHTKLLSIMANVEYKQSYLRKI